jgi:hypothetical protein
MTKQSYNLAKIRDLLVNGFTDDDLRRQCFNGPKFCSVYEEITQDPTRR